MEGIIKTAIANGIDLERPGVEVSYVDMLENS